MQHIKEVSTQPFSDQKFGTSGIRKKVKFFEQKHYIENIVQSIFDTYTEAQLKDSIWLISGDGRYYIKEAINRITKVCAGNQVKAVWIGKDGLISTPAGSGVIRYSDICEGGLLLTASHNPGGKDYDFGIKWNTKSGAPAGTQLTKQVDEKLLTIKSYKSVDELSPIDFNQINTGDVMCLKPGGGVEKCQDNKLHTYHLTCKIIDPVDHWLGMMKKIFDFDKLKKFLHNRSFKMAYDALHGVGGIYGRKLFVEEFGLSPETLIHCDLLPDFGKLHPDPNPMQADYLYNLMKCPRDFHKFLCKTGDDQKSSGSDDIDFGAATDGDCDRAMILGKGVYVNPCDSLAVITYYAEKCIPYFINNKVLGVARSMPTSKAVDSVAEKLKIDCYEVPTGWKFFGNLMDAEKINLCGEESFGAGSSYIREKDGLWAILCWLSILAYKSEEANKLVAVSDVLKSFFTEFGRFYFCRYDFEEIPVHKGKNIFNTLQSCIDQYKSNPHCFDQSFKSVKNISSFDHFSYKDSVDNTVSTNQGIQLIADGIRIIYRSSGTSSEGITLRLYIEKYEKTHIDCPPVDYLKDVYADALFLSSLKELSGMDVPTTIS